MKKLRALFLFLSFLLLDQWKLMDPWTTLSQSIKESLALFCLAYSVGNNKMAFILFPFFKNHSLVYLHTIWMLALGHTFLAKSYVGRDSDETAFSKAHLNYGKEWGGIGLIWKVAQPSRRPVCPLESSWGVCRPRQVEKICFISFKIPNQILLTPFYFK